jgi:hypothetical protein
MLGMARRIARAAWSVSVRSFSLPTVSACLLAVIVFTCVPLDAQETVPETASGVMLAEDGHALLKIVISEKASERTVAVAAELAQYLQRITGAEFEVGAGDGTTGIVLGTLAEFPDAALDEPLTIRNGFDGREAYAIRSEGERLRLIGATDRGVSHAAFALLEHLGCRWFFPAPEWEVIPQQRTLRVALDATSRPALLARRIWYGYGYFSDPHTPADRAGASGDYFAWARHNRMDQSFSVYCGHAWQSIIADHHDVFESHPEYLALVQGKRQGEQLCVSHPEVRRLAVAWALDYLAKHPEADMVSMEPSDGDGQCECEACRQLGSISDRAFGLANEVARAVAQKHPGKLVGLYAYNEHCEPPTFDLEPNVYVQLTAGFIRGQYSFDELAELWPQRCGNLGFYEYFSVWLWDFDRLPGGRAADLAYLQQQIGRYAAGGATSLDCESGNNWGPHGLGYYLANRLMWDPQIDVEALQTDFYQQAFGPAAAPMRRYYERFNPGNKPLMSQHLIGLGFRDVEEATRLAAGRPDVLKRLEHIQQYLRYVHLRWQYDRAQAPQDKERWTLEVVKHAYRTRYSYMNHWEAIRQGWLMPAAGEYHKPEWLGDNPPWAADAYTAAETAAAFREGLEYFQPEEVDEQRFSSDLVPVGWDVAADPPASMQSYQGSVRYAFYSSRGEPLEFTTVTGTIAWYRDRAPARWEIVDRDGRRIDGGRLPLDGQEHSLHCEVPTAGLYYLQFDDSAAGWSLKVDAGRVATVELEAGRGFAHAGWMQPMVFYVPKGTRELQYYWSGGPHLVHGPDGRILREVDQSGAFIRIPVSPGDDGRVWSFSQIALGHLWFFNAPNLLAASPAALLVPRELAKRDSLRIQQP